MSAYDDMTSLTRAAILSRKAIRYSIYGIIAFIILRFLFGLAISAYRTAFPAPPPPPTVRFDTLPALTFPDQAPGTFEGFAFDVRTLDGTLPVLPEQISVYFIPKPSVNIRSVDHVKEKAGELGYNPNGRELVETIYSFESPDTPSTLSINVNSKLFSIALDLNSAPNLVNSVPPPPIAAINKAVEFLDQVDLLPEDLSGPTSHQFLKFENDELKEAISLSEADMTKVNLFRADIDEIPVTTTDPEEANVWFIFSGDDSTRHSQIVRAEYHYLPVDYEESATYPLKTMEEALSDLQSGNAYLASYNGNGNVVIREVYLAYFDPDRYTEFLQPVVVFKGDDDFVAYVPAISSQYYGGSTQGSETEN